MASYRARRGFAATVLAAAGTIAALPSIAWATDKYYVGPANGTGTTESIGLRSNIPVHAARRFLHPDV